MRYSVLVEPVEEGEKMPGWFYAHVPSLGVTTHGQGIEGALDAARDLIHLWVDEKKAAGENPAPAPRVRAASGPSIGGRILGSVPE